MLQKARRLTGAQVREVLKKGRSLVAPSMSAKYLGSEAGKAAVVVSKKVAKSAVKRNTMRRKIYDALPRPLPRAHMVFLVRKSMPDYAADIATICSRLSS